MRFFVILLGIGFIFSSCGDNKPNNESKSSVDTMTINYSVVSTLPHNTDAYTQGLIIYNNKVLESTGQKGHSWIAEVNPGSGNHDKKVTLDNRCLVYYPRMN